MPLSYQVEQALVRFQAVGSLRKFTHPDYAISSNPLRHILQGIRIVSHADYIILRTQFPQDPLRAWEVLTPLEVNQTVDGSPLLDEPDCNIAVSGRVSGDAYHPERIIAYARIQRDDHRLFRRERG